MSNAGDQFCKWGTPCIIQPLLCSPRWTNYLPVPHGRSWPWKHRLQAAFPMSQPIPTCWLVFSSGPEVIVARGAEFEGQQPASYCGIYLLPFHFPSSWIRLLWPDHPTSLRVRDSFWPTDFCDYFFLPHETSLALILFHNLYWFCSLRNLVCFVLNQESLGLDLPSQEPLVSTRLLDPLLLLPIFPRKSSVEVWSGDQSCHFRKIQQETLRPSHTQDNPWPLVPISRNPRRCFRTGRPADYSFLKWEDGTLQQTGSPAMPRAHPSRAVTQHSDQGKGWAERRPPTQSQKH